MATFDSTLGGSAATSYVTVNEADVFLANTRFTATWQGNSEEQKTQFLNAATSYLDVVQYAGTRCNPSTDNANLPQALSWPRSGASCDGVQATCAAIPKAIKEATILLAVNLSANPDAISGPIGGRPDQQAGVYVSKNQLGDLVQEFSEYSSDPNSDCDDCATPEAIKVFPWLKPMLSCWATIGSVNSRVLLRVRS